jgi:(1->4)-alpha-D-glucan 1-alpha-D-glucosylmutase
MVVDGKPVPSRNEEYLLYQTLVGTWPFCKPDAEEFSEFRSRIKEYMLKAMREAKVHTSWINPNTLREDAVMYFIDMLLKVTPDNRFLQDFTTFQNVTARCGMFNSLSQTLLKITSPGIPDFYQGNELWDFSLVDPDNRRPVNYSLRRKLLDDLIRKESADGLLETVRELVTTPADGRIKLYLTCKALAFRQHQHELFQSGRYLPLAIEGTFQEHVCAFERSINNRSVLVVVPRFFNRLINGSDGLPLGPEVWQDTRLLQPFDTATSCYRNVFTGEVLCLDQQDGVSGLALKEILAVFPVALLERLDTEHETP